MLMKAEKEVLIKMEKSLDVSEIILAVASYTHLHPSHQAFNWNFLLIAIKLRDIDEQNTVAKVFFFSKKGVFPVITFIL